LDHSAGRWQFDYAHSPGWAVLARYPHVENAHILSFGGSPLFKDVLAKGPIRCLSADEPERWSRPAGCRPPQANDYPLGDWRSARPVRVILADWNHQATYLDLAALATVLLVGMSFG